MNILSRCYIKRNIDNATIRVAKMHESIGRCASNVSEIDDDMSFVVQVAEDHECIHVHLAVDGFSGVVTANIGAAKDSVGGGASVASDIAEDIAVVIRAMEAVASDISVRVMPFFAVHGKINRRFKNEQEH